MIAPRSPVLRLVDSITALAFIALVAGLFFGAIASIAITVIRWLTGWPA